MASNLDFRAEATPALTRKKYKLISNAIRQKLIYLIVKEQMNVVEAAKLTDINYENAKAIYRVYKREGRGDRKHMKEPHNGDTPVGDRSPVDKYKIEGLKEAVRCKSKPRRVATKM